MTWTEKKTVLFIGGGIEAVPIIRIAKDLGLRVAVLDGDQFCPGKALADAFHRVSIYDVGGAISASLEAPPNAVLCAATDAPLTAAAVADVCNLPGPSIETAFICQDKVLMKARLRRCEIPVPWFSGVKNEHELLNIHRARSQGQDKALVVKPVDSRGGRGVHLLMPGAYSIDIGYAFAHAANNSPSERVMVEDFITGPQFSAEALVVGGKSYLLGLSGRNYMLARFAPCIIEDGSDMPVTGATWAGAARVMQEAANCIGLRQGTLKGDLVFSFDQVMTVIEVAPRLSGGYFCEPMIRLATGIPFVEHAIRIALGEQTNGEDLEPTIQWGVSQRYFVPEPGRVVAIEGVEEARSMEGVELLDIRVKEGDRIRPYTHHARRPGTVIAKGANQDAAVAIAEKVVSTINIQTMQGSE